MGSLGREGLICMLDQGLSRTLVVYSASWNPCHMQLFFLIWNSMWVSTEDSVSPTQCRKWMDTDYICLWDLLDSLTNGKKKNWARISGSAVNGHTTGFGYVILIDIGMQTWIIGNSKKENAVNKINTRPSDWLLDTSWREHTYLSWTHQENIEIS
jgi:hypothetical protein